MQTFISETIAKIIKQHEKFNDVVLILPSQRSKVFVRQELVDTLTSVFLPEIINIEEFVGQVSGIKKIDSIELLFHFYSIYKQQEQKPDSFAVFSSWATTVIQDFNEIDQHLVNTQDIFTYIRDIQRLRKWSVKGSFKETELIKDHHNFLEKLNQYYAVFYKFLLENKVGYQGVLYREAVKYIDDFIERNTNKTFYFIGFNSLNGAEEVLVQKLLSHGNSQVFWDIDVTFLENNHQAGTFIRKYLNNWKYYEKNTIESSNWFTQKKNIQVIGAAKNISQIKYAGQLLSEFDDFQNTALVLADEALLPITLNSFPKNLNKVNITMGYPLKDIPTTHLITSIFQLFLTQDKLGKVRENLFYYKSVISFFKQASIYRLVSEKAPDVIEQIITDITTHNRMFVSKSYISSFFKDIIVSDFKEVLDIFTSFTTIEEFLIRILQLFSVIKEDIPELEKEYIYRYHSAFEQLQNLQRSFSYLTDLKTLSQFFKQIISSETLAFKGEPLKGLQLMGMLETRVLDFKNIILTSVNEGVLPKSNQQTSFIPFDVKVAFGLPTYREKDAIFAYYFFRLLQRSENIFLLYNTETDAFGKGEKSRFIKQLELIREDVVYKFVSPKVPPTNYSLQKIEKNIHIIEKLKQWGAYNISPSALTSYLYNPIVFYKQKVLGIQELDQVEETAQVNTMGTVVHDTLDELYQPYLNEFLTPQHFEKMEIQIRNLVAKHFQKQFKNGDITTGKNRLIFEVAIRFVSNFLKQEKLLVTNKTNRLRVLATEQKMSVVFDDFKYPVKIGGTVDRIDELNGVLRIIDYKTGKVTASQLKVSFMNEIIDYKFHKAIQVMLYAYMYTEQNGMPSQPIEAGIISFKNLKSGFLKLNFSQKYRGQDNEVTQDRISEFMTYIKALLTEIFDEDLPFEEPKELAY